MEHDVVVDIFVAATICTVNSLKYHMKRTFETLKMLSLPHRRASSVPHRTVYHRGLRWRRECEKACALRPPENYFGRCLLKKNSSKQGRTRTKQSSNRPYETQLCPIDQLHKDSISWLKTAYPDVALRVNPVSSSRSKFKRRQKSNTASLRITTATVGYLKHPAGLWSRQSISLY